MYKNFKDTYLNLKEIPVCVKDNIKQNKKLSTQKEINNFLLNNYKYYINNPDFAVSIEHNQNNFPKMKFVKI